MSNNNGVDLSTGKLNLPLTLATLTGPNGFNETVGIVYSTVGLLDQIKSRNQDAPTGLCGLGWTMSIPYIARMGNGSINDKFYLNSSPLVLKSKIGNATNGYHLEFETVIHDMSRISYDSTTETWTIVDTSGVTYVYGGKDLHEDAIEWAIRWVSTDGQSPKVWIGSSLETDNQQRYALIWNLSYKLTIYGQRINYQYNKISSNVGKDSGGRDYDMTSYLVGIQIENGASLKLSYAEKETWEYPSLRIQYNPDSGLTTNPYQDRIATQYLSNLCLYDTTGVIQQNINLNYGFLYENLGASITNSSHYPQINKRILLSIDTLTPDGLAYAPAQGFDYWGYQDDGFVNVFTTALHNSPDLLLKLTDNLLASAPAFVDPSNDEQNYQPLFGHLKNIQSPSGAVAWYSYSEVSANYNSVWNDGSWDKDWKNLLQSAQINHPDGENVNFNWYNARPYWGPDGYVVIRWDSKKDKQICLQIFEWVAGQWVQCDTGYKPYFNVKDFDDQHIIINTGMGKFGLIRTDYLSTGEGSVIIFNRKPYIPGQWRRNDLLSNQKFKPATKDNPAYSVQMGFGDNIAAVLDKMGGQLYLYSLNNENRWSKYENPITIPASAPTVHLSTLCVTAQEVFVVNTDTLHTQAFSYWLYYYDPIQGFISNDLVGKLALDYDLFGDGLEHYSIRNIKSIILSQGSGFLLLAATLEVSGQGVGAQTYVNRSIAISWDDDRTQVNLQKINNYQNSQNYWGVWGDTAWALNSSTVPNEISAVSNLINQTWHKSDKFKNNKQVLRFIGSSTKDAANNVGWNLDYQMKNLDDNSDSWVVMATIDTTVATSDTSGTYSYVLYQYDPIQGWVAQNNVAMGQNKDWEAVIETVEKVIQYVSISFMMAGSLMAPLSMVAEELGAAVEMLVGIFEVYDTALNGPQSMINGFIESAIESAVLRNLLSGRRNGIAESTNYLIVGTQKNKILNTYYKEWDSSKYTYIWKSLGQINPTDPIYPKGHSGPGGKETILGISEDTYFYCGNFGIFGYVIEQYDTSGFTANHYLHSDQVIIFRNGLVQNVLRMPLATLPKDDGSHYSNLTDLHQLPYLNTNSSDHPYLMAAPWGAILGYLPNTDDDVWSIKQSDIDEAYFLVLLKVQNENITGSMTDYVVNQVAMNDGYQCYNTFYQYMPKDAYLQKSKNTVLYNCVRVAAGGSTYSNSAQQYGWSEQYFYTPKPFYDPVSKGFIYDPANKKDAKFLEDNQDQTNVAYYLKLMVGKSYCQRIMKSQGKSDDKIGYEESRQYTFYKAYQTNLIDYATGNSIGEQQSFGVVPTLSISLLAPDNNQYLNINTAYNEHQAVLSMQYTFYDIDYLRAPWSPNAPTELMNFSIKAGDKSISLNSALPYASLSISYDVSAANGFSAMKPCIKGRYQQSLTSWYIAGLDATGYENFIKLNLFTTLQSSIWANENLNFTNDSNGNPIITAATFWQRGWEIISSQASTWQTMTIQGHTTTNWYPASNYMWQGNADGSKQTTFLNFDWVSAREGNAIPNWVQSGASTLVENGITLAAINMIGTPSAVIYNTNQTASIASFTNSNVANTPAFYLGFESYENLAALDFYQGSTLTSLSTILTNRYSNTGNRSAICAPLVGQTLYAWSKTFDVSTITPGLWMASINYLITGEDTSTSAPNFEVRVSVNTDNINPSSTTQLNSIPMQTTESLENQWATSQMLVDLKEQIQLAKLNNNTLSIIVDIDIPSGYHNTIYVDNICFAPVQTASFSISTYDSANKQAITSAIPADYSFANRTIYNNRGQTIASVRKQLTQNQTDSISMSGKNLYPEKVISSLPLPAQALAAFELSFVNQSESFSIDDQDFTIEFWYQSSLSPSQFSWDLCPPYLLPQFDTFSLTIQQGYIYLKKFGVRFDIELKSTINIQDGNFHHIAFTWSLAEATLILYVDAQLQAQGSADRTFVSFLEIGPIQASNSNNILELRIWNNLQSLGQIIQTMNTRLSGEEPGLMGYWPFNGNSDDLSIYKHNAIVTNGQFIQTNLKLLPVSPYFINTQFVMGAAGTYIEDKKNYTAGQYFDFRDGKNSWAGGTVIARQLHIHAKESATYPITSSLTGLGVRAQLQGWVEKYHTEMQSGTYAVGLPAATPDGNLWGAFTYSPNATFENLYAFNIDEKDQLIQQISSSINGAQPVLNQEKLFAVDPIKDRLFAVVNGLNSDNKYYHLFNFSNNDAKQIYQFDELIYTPISSLNNMLYFADYYNAIYYVDISHVDTQDNFNNTITELVSYKTILTNATCQAPPAANASGTSIACVLNNDQHSVIVKYDILNKHLTTKEIAGTLSLNSSPCLAESGAVFAVYKNNELHAYDANLDLVNKVLLNDPVVGNLVTGNGIITVAFTSGQLTLFDFALNVIAHVQVANAIVGSPVIHGNKISVVGKTDNQFAVYSYNTAGILACAPYIAPATQNLEIQAISPNISDLLLLRDNTTFTRLYYGVPSASLAIGNYVVNWDAAQSQYSLTGTPQAVNPVTITSSAAGDWLLTIINNTLYFFADGQQIFAEAITDLPAQGSSYKISAGANELAVRDIIVLNNPTMAMNYYDGAGKLRQSQTLAEIVPPKTALSTTTPDKTQVCLLVREQLYDNLGRNAINTVAAAKGIGAINRAAFAFEIGFISDRSGSNPAFKGAALTGNIQDWVDTANFTQMDDTQYAYTGQYFEADPTSRLLQSSGPGVKFNKDSDHTTTYANGWMPTNPQSQFTSSLDLSTGQLNSQYGLSAQTLSLGNVGTRTQASVTSLSGRQISAMSMDLNQPTHFIMQTSVESVGADNQNGMPTMAVSLSALPNVYDTQHHIQNAANYVITQKSNSVGNVIYQQSPDAGITQYYYDNASRIRFSQNADQATKNSGGIVNYYLYDALNRVIEMGFFDSAWDIPSFAKYCENLSITPSPNGKNVLRKFEYSDVLTGQLSGLGRISWTFSSNTLEKSDGSVCVNPQSQVQNLYHYSPQGQVIELRSFLTLPNGSSNHTTKYLYHCQGQVANITYSDGFTVFYDYNIQGNMAKVGHTQDSSYYANYQYDVNGKVINERLADATLLTEYQYGNSLGQLTQISSSLTNANTQLFSETLSYTDNNGAYQDGNIQSAHYRYGSQVGAATSDYYYQYQYDIFGRLTAANAYNTPNNHPIINWSMANNTIDANGNLRTVTHGETSITYNYQAGTNQLDTRTDVTGNYSYTANGLTKKTPSGKTFIYDQLTLLPVKVQNTSFVYDNSGERLYKQIGEKRCTYIRGGTTSPLMEIDQNKHITHYVYGPLGLICINNAQNDQNYFILKDHLSSTRVVYANKTNEVAAYYTYLPYGKTTEQGGVEAANLRYLYTGQEWDAEIGFYNYHARQYDPAFGRFLTPDPAHQLPSPYVYVANNPVNKIDPTGQIIETPIENFGNVLDHEGVNYLRENNIYSNNPEGAHNPSYSGQIIQDMINSDTTHSFANTSTFNERVRWQIKDNFIANIQDVNLVTEPDIARNGNFKGYRRQNFKISIASAALSDAFYNSEYGIRGAYHEDPYIGREFEDKLLNDIRLRLLDGELIENSPFTEPTVFEKGKIFIDFLGGEGETRGQGEWRVETWKSGEETNKKYNLLSALKNENENYMYTISTAFIREPGETIIPDLKFFAKTPRCRMTEFFTTGFS